MTGEAAGMPGHTGKFVEGADEVTTDTEERILEGAVTIPRSAPKMGRGA